LKSGEVPPTVVFMDVCTFPRETVSFEQFARHPRPSIALDGYVYGPSRWDSAGHFNFNHHDDVDRFATRSTCEQVALALRASAPFELEESRVCVNDDDPDVSLSVWLLEHPEMVWDPAVISLCTMQGVIDTCGGATGQPSPGQLAQLAWIIEPWASRTGNLRDRYEMEEIIKQTGERITAFSNGRGEMLRNRWGYTTVARSGSIWAVVEDHPLARAQVCADGAEIFVAIKDHEGHRTVSIGKASPFVDCDLEVVWSHLNRLDQSDGMDCWGGGDMIGGSPRLSGTGLDARAILEVLSAVRETCT
jgi:hypothetical protein